MRFPAKLALKTAAHAVILSAALRPAGLSPGETRALAAATAAALYLTGDSVVLPVLGNRAATVADGALAALLVASLGSIMGDRPVDRRSALRAGLGIAAFENLFHRFLRRV